LDRVYEKLSKDINIGTTDFRKRVKKSKLNSQTSISVNTKEMSTTKQDFYTCSYQLLDYV